MKFHDERHISACTKEQRGATAGGEPRISGEGTPARAHPRAVPAAHGLGLTPVAVSRWDRLSGAPLGVCRGGVTARGYGARSGLQGKGVLRRLWPARRLSALGAGCVCAEHPTESGPGEHKLQV